MPELKPRALASAVEAALSDTPVVVINGARQVGKTTLVRHIRYPGAVDLVSLDDLGMRQAARTDPRSFVDRRVDTLVIDEAQLEPVLFRAIKAAVDLDRRPGRFLLTGSSRLLSAPDMADSLVGRVETLELWPFSQGELLGRHDRFVDLVFEDPARLVRSQPLQRQDLITRIVAGGYPEATSRSQARRTRWFESYLTTLSQSTLRDLAEIERLAEMPRLLRLCAARTATELNVAAIASDFGIPARTTDGYLALLETAFVLQRIPAWSTNASSKVVRRPKLVLNDSALAAYLLAATPATIEAGGAVGPLLETFVANELKKQLGWSEQRARLFHFRDRGGAEVDLLLEHPDGRVVGIEVKATASPIAADLKGLRFLADRLGDRFAFGVVLTTSPDAIPFGPKTAALPVSALWAEW